MNKKRWISLLLTLSLCLGLLPGVTLATEEGTQAALPEGYEQMYVQDDDDGYTTVVEGAAGIGGDIWLYSRKDDVYSVLNDTEVFTITCDEALGEVGKGLNGTNWRKQNAKLGAEGYIYAVNGDLKYAIQAKIVADPGRIYDDKGYSFFTVSAGQDQAFTFPPIIYPNSEAVRITQADYNFTCDASIGTLFWHEGFNELGINTAGITEEAEGKIYATDGNGVEYSCTVRVEAASGGDQGGSGGEEETPKLMYRYMNRSNGQFYEDTSRSLVSVSELSVTYGGRETVRFYYGTDDDYVPVTSVTVSGGNCMTATACTTTDGTPYWELDGTDLGTAALSFVADEQTYSAAVPVILPVNGFFTNYADLSKETYLPDGFTYDGTNNTFYLVWNDSHSYIPANSEVSINYWDGDQSGQVRAELVETGESFTGNDGVTAKRHAIKFTVVSANADRFGFEVSFELINREGGTETNNWGIRITNNTPKLLFRYMNWSNGQPYEDTGRSLIPVSELRITYTWNEVVRFYYGTTDNNVPVTSVSVSGDNCMTVTANTTTDGNSTPYWELKGTDLGTATLSFVVGEQTYSAAVSVVLPDYGFYTSYTDLSKETLLPYSEFIYDGENDTFYLVWNGSHSYIPADSEVSITYTDGEQSGQVRAELVETGESFTGNDGVTAKRHAIKFTVVSANADRFGFDFSFEMINRNGVTEITDNGARVINNTPKLLYRYMNWSNGQPYEDTSRSLVSVSELSVTYGGREVVRFYYGTDDDYVPVISVTVSGGNCMTVTACTTTDGTPYWELDGTDLGTAALSFVADEQTYSAAVPVILPANGFYTSYTDLSKETYLPNGFTYGEESSTFYLVWNNSHSYIPANSEVSINYWNGDQSGPVSAQLVETGEIFTGNDGTTAKRHAIKFTVANTVSDDFGFDFDFELINRNGDPEPNNWGINVNGISDGSPDGPGDINFLEELISDTRPVEDADKITNEESERLENGPSAFRYDVNGDGKPETYYLCTMAPIHNDPNQFGMAYAGGTSQPYDKDAHFMSPYCIGIWTYNADADYYTLVSGETKDTLLAAFGDSWSVEAYNVKDRTGATPATSFPAVYSWTPADGWPIGRAFVLYADCIGSWDYVFTGTIGGKTVSAKAHCGYGFSYEHLEYDAVSVADANEKLIEWSALKEAGFDFMGDTTYTINLPAGTLTGIIEVPGNMEVDLNGSASDERTVLVGGVAGDGCAHVRDIDFVGCGWQNTHWPNDDVYHGKANYGLSTVKGGDYYYCSFKNYFHAIHCGPTNFHVPILIFGGAGTLFENNFIAVYLNSTMNGGGNMIMLRNTFRHNGCALWMENTGNDFPMNSFALLECKFYDNGWDVINLLDLCYFLPGQFFERDGKYGHGKFTNDRKAITHGGASPRSAKVYASSSASNASEVGSGVYTFPVAKDGTFTEFDYTNSNAVIANFNASDWRIPEDHLDGKTITVIQDAKGEDVTIWSFGEEN